MRRSSSVTAPALLAASLLAAVAAADDPRHLAGRREINPPADPAPGRVIALLGARLVDGRGGPPVPDSAILIRGPRIVAAGPRASVAVPADARAYHADGLAVLPGLIDTHFHNDDGGEPVDLPALVLSRGVTSLRDPSLPIPDYDPVRHCDRPMPRCFLTGRHLDQAPHAHPHDAVAVRSPDEARDVVARHLADGASAIKVYFRLPTDLIRAACDAAHHRGAPVTAHLELIDARDAIPAGLDGVEHVTSFGTALATPDDAARFREAVRRDNEARRDGRYRLWAALDLGDPGRTRPVIDLLRAHRVVVTPTLAVFERRPGDPGAGADHVRGFRNMVRFVGLCHRAGVPIAVGSHTTVPHAARGDAYLRELELLVESGLGPGEAIAAATSGGAGALGCDDRLGVLAGGMLADLILVDGDPLADIRAVRSVRHVMLNGRWVGEGPGPAGGPGRGP